MRARAGAGCPSSARDSRRAGSSSTASTIVSALTKRAMSSTWPCVSSPTQPSPSQIVCADAEPLAEDALVVRAGQARVAHLDVAEQPFLGHEQQAVAVDLDAAAFEHDDALPSGSVGSTRGSPVMRGDRRADLIVALPVVVLRPGVEAPVQRDGRCRRRRCTPVGAESRSQTRSVGTMCRRTRSSATPCASSAWRARRSARLGRDRGSRPARARRGRATISAYTHGIGPSLPGQSGSWCGQAIQVARCGSHSAGIRRR